mmetsp:Transcript_12762/g.20784  ORF Transcript_12762/g.20784 Transcript_12762/m.20784 type:complete len:276 (+) Transcript_12762:83-910(+)
MSSHFLLFYLLIMILLIAAVTVTATPMHTPGSSSRVKPKPNHPSPPPPTKQKISLPGRINFPPYYYKDKKTFQCFPSLGSEENNFTDMFNDIDMDASRTCKWRPILNESQTWHDYNAISKLFHHAKSEWGSVSSLQYLEVTCDATSAPLAVDDSATPPSFLTRMSALMNELRRMGIRKLYFCGDSVMRQQWQVTNVVANILNANSFLQIEYMYFGNNIASATSTEVKKLWRKISHNDSVVVANFGNAVVCVFGRCYVVSAYLHCYVFYKHPICWY